MKSDLDLMSAFRAGDESAFDKLVKRHQVGLLNFFYRLVWDRSLAEDLTQEVFMRLYTHKKDYEPNVRFSIYLYRIGRACWLDYRRRTKPELDGAQIPAGAAPALTTPLPLRGEDTHDAARKDELADALVEAVAELPEEQMLVFVLSEVQGMRYQEIAETIGVSPAAVKTRMYQALKRLKDNLSRSMKGATGPLKADGENG
jgi:RNA polymerase sigma-70 factor (ECF subfamily)